MMTLQFTTYKITDSSNEVAERNECTGPIDETAQVAYQGTLSVVPDTDLPAPAAEAEIRSGEGGRQREKEEEQQDTPLRRRFLKEGGRVVEVVQLGEEREAGICGRGTPTRGRATPVRGRGTPITGRNTPTKGATSLLSMDMSASKTDTPSKGRSTPASGRATPNNGRVSPTKHHLEVAANGFYFSCEIPLSKVVPKKAGTPTKTSAKSNHRGKMGNEALSLNGSPARTQLFKDRGVKDASPNAKNVAPKHNVTSSPTKKTPNWDSKGSPRKPQNSTPLRNANTPDSTKRIAKTVSSARQNTVQTASPSKGDKLSLKNSYPIGHLPSNDKENTNTIIRSPTIASHNSNQPAKTKPRASMSGAYDMGGLMARLKDTSSPRAAQDKLLSEETNTSAPPTPLRKAAEKVGIITPVFAVVKSRNVAEKLTRTTISSVSTTEGSEENSDDANEHSSTSSAPEKVETDTGSSIPLPQEATDNSPEREHHEQSEGTATSASQKHVHFQRSSRLATTIEATDTGSMAKSDGTEAWVMRAMQKEMDGIQQSLMRDWSGRSGESAGSEAAKNSHWLPGQEKKAQNPTPAQRPRGVDMVGGRSSQQKLTPTGRVVAKNSRNCPGTRRTESTPAAGKTSTARSTISGNRKAPRSINTPRAKTPAYARPTQTSLASTVITEGTTYKKNTNSRRTADINVASRCEVQNFISAGEISERVKKWHEEERETHDLASPDQGQSSKQQLKLAEELSADTPAYKHQAHHKSTTPQVSPPSSPIYHPQPTPLHPALKHTHLPGTKINSPKTRIFPSPKRSPLQKRRLKEQNHKTPMKSKIPSMDLNAFRTPSKEIEQSLDAAIDRKIREDMAMFGRGEE